MKNVYGKSGLLIGWFSTTKNSEGRDVRVFIERRKRDVLIDLLIRMHGETDEHPAPMTSDEALTLLEAMDSASLSALLKFTE